MRLWIGLLPFFKGSLTWENNAIFSSHCFTLRQHLNSTINSERDRNLKPLKTDIWFDIYSFISLLLFNKNDTWRPTCFIVQTTGFNRPAKFLILLKHWAFDNFELNWFHGLSKSPAIPFSPVSADSFRFNIQKCSRSLYAFIAFRPTCFAWRLVMRNLHETSTQRAR